MNEDKIIGLLILIGSILEILSWIGYTLATTPLLKQIEEIEKELEEVKKQKLHKIEKLLFRFLTNF
jgi:predicted DNA-binding transcriptional regulator